MSWHDAHAHCQNLNGDLASFFSQEEVDGIPTAVGDKFHWIGLNDQLKENIWVWSDGSTTTWLNWKNGQPNDGEQGNCVYMKKGKLYDNLCHEGWPFLCKIPGIYLKIDVTGVATICALIITDFKSN